MKINLFFLFLLSSFAFLAQTPLRAQRAEISGTVVDPEDQKLAFANVILNNLPDSSLVKVGVTDEAGRFQLAGLSPGEYYLEISYVGLPSLRENLSLAANEEKHYDHLKMPSAGGTDLEEVVIAARRPLLELKNDRMIFNVENSINATGNNGLELLRKSPGVIIDNNNNITLLGRPGVRIFVNGKPSPLRGDELATYLQSLQSTDIDAIEIITNPGSRYEAEGNAGIINIKLRKDKGLGANGNLNLGYAIGIRPMYNAGLSGNYRNKWMNIYGSYSFTQNYWTNRFNLDRTQNGFRLDQYTRPHGSNQPQNFKGGADFFLSKKSTLGLLVEGTVNHFDSRVPGRSELGEVGAGGPDSLLISDQIGKGKSTNLNYNLNYLWQIKEGASLSIDANYGKYTSERREYQPNYYMDINEEIILSQNINETFAPTIIDITAMKVDYETPLWKGTLGAGVKYSLVNTDNDFQFYNVIEEENVVDVDRTNQFRYSEKVNAAYLNYSNKLGKHLNFQLGLRMEDTRSTGDLTALKPTNNERVDRDYLDWFPSASLNVSAGEHHKFQLSYSRRINRPSYQSLNPFEWKLDELTFHRGNPFLQPEYSNIIQLRHAFKYKLNTTLSYSYTNDMMALQPQAGEGKIGFRTWINLPHQYNYSINVAAPTPVTDWWSSMVSLTAYYRENKGDLGEGKVIDLAVWAFNGYTQQTFTVKKGLSFEVSGFYNSPTVSEASAQTFSQWSVDIGMKVQVLNGNGNLTLGLSDIFRTNRWAGEIYLGDFYAEMDARWDSRRFRINFSYLFGNQQVKKARNRKTGLEEEKKRTSG